MKYAFFLVLFLVIWAVHNFYKTWWTLELLITGAFGLGTLMMKAYLHKELMFQKQRKNVNRKIECGMKERNENNINSIRKTKRWIYGRKPKWGRLNESYGDLEFL